MVAMEVLATASVAPNPETPWLIPLISILTVVLGGGGLAAILKVIYDKRMGVAQQESEEDAAISNRWAQMIKIQGEALVEPLSARIGTLEGKVLTLETDLALSRRKYWSAVSHIRTLYNWIARHMPEDIEQTQIPAPPTTLAEDL